MDVSTTIEVRNHTHGDFEDNARISQQLKVILEAEGGYADLDDVQREAIDMIALKLSRILSGDPNHVDHWHDIAGYATLVEQHIVGRASVKAVKKALEVE